MKKVYIKSWFKRKEWKIKLENSSKVSKPCIKTDKKFIKFDDTKTHKKKKEKIIVSSKNYFDKEDFKIFYWLKRC